MTHTLCPSHGHLLHALEETQQLSCGCSQQQNVAESSADHQDHDSSLHVDEL